MGSIGTLLLPRFVLPVRPERTVLREHAVRLLDGRIDAILPADEAAVRYPDDDRVDLGRHALLPGFVNAHTHSPMSLLRGYADDLALDAWLREHIWPAEQRWVSPEFVREGTQLALVEMLRGGVTCFNEMYFFPEVIAETADEAGLRAVIGAPVIDVPTPWASGIAECLERSRELVDRFAATERIDVALAPHAPYTVDEAGLAAVKALSEETGVRVNMHVLEAAWEIRHSREQFGKGPLQRLHGHGLLGPEFMAVHMVHLDEADIALLVETGTHVIHCPESNLKLGNGVCPVPALLEAGVNVALGTDGAASNNDLDLLGEARTAALVAKGFSGDPEALDAWKVLDLMTINGARAMGRESDFGTIEPGKLADLCAFDLDWPETQPVHRVHAQVVYSAASRQVSDVWVGGRRLLEAGAPTTLDLPGILASAEAWNARMKVA